MKHSLPSQPLLKCLLLLILLTPLLTGCFIWTSGAASKPTRLNLMPPIDNDGDRLITTGSTGERQTLATSR